MAKQRHACGYRLVWIVLANDGKLTSIGLIPELWLIFVLSTVNVVVNWILDATKTKAAVQDSTAVLLIALAEAWILVQLR